MNPKVTQEELNSIVAGEFTWIKVKKYVDVLVNPTVDDYNRLIKHHNEETTFLINKCKGLASDLLYIKYLNLSNRILTLETYGQGDSVRAKELRDKLKKLEMYLTPEQMTDIV